jgi:hypothetical protein
MIRLPEVPAKALFLLVAILVVTSDVALSAALSYPGILLDDPAVAAALVARTANPELRDGMDQPTFMRSSTEAHRRQRC